MKMPRYIDADELKKCAAHAQIYTKHLNDDGSVTYEMHVTDAVTVKDIENAPTVDAVEVVRCKDCVHAGAFPNKYAERRFEGCMNCFLCRGDDGYGIANVSVVYPDDYCSDGVRREE